MRRLRFGVEWPATPAFSIGDGLLLLAIATILYIGARLAFESPQAVTGPEISLSLKVLPWYAFLSVSRMTAAYLLSLTFSLAYGYASAYGRTAEKVLSPLLDVLQSVPILSFLPVVLLSLTAVLPPSIAAEIAAIVLIFTSMAWNMTYSFYQSLKTLPTELREASSIFRLDPWLRFKTVELPFGALPLIWNSMMSWAGGWFFLMAAEMFTVGQRNFQLPGLGSYLNTAANAGNLQAVAAGVITLVIVILLLDQLVWRPALSWADKFKLESTAGEAGPTSWFYNMMSRSWVLGVLRRRIWTPLVEGFDGIMRRRMAGRVRPAEEEGSAPVKLSWPTRLVLAAVIGVSVYGGFRAIQFLGALTAAGWASIGLGLLFTFLRVVFSLGIALLLTIPLGVAIGTNRRLAAILQPVIQVMASVPATALFPVILLFLVGTTAGLNLAAVGLMLMGAIWYLLFNVIAGASAIPQDLRFTTALLRLGRSDRFRALTLPALLPFLVTGGITASGGAWNASIVAEHVTFGGQSYAVVGIGAVIAQATGSGNYPLLLGGTLALIFTVVFINRTFWRRLYRLAEEKYRME